MLCGVDCSRVWVFCVMFGYLLFRCSEIGCVMGVLCLIVYCFMGEVCSCMLCLVGWLGWVSISVIL